MEYDVVISIDGFENEKKFILEKIDDFFSVIRGVETESELRLMSFGALKSLKFELPEEFTEKLEIQTIDDISIYYIFVLQTANNDNSLNTFSPVILNNKTKKMGQIHLDLKELGLEGLNDMLPNF
ncbi:hypothetical protein CPU12_02040 [Malaciobacter molluscorum LMG 25693]|uniref:Flagellin level sensor protein FliW n=1 Tax=Malaciobacter molluscorum LMG 25693 TaxID=870501 RepID=A0A2G1DKR2_9BACT|nr:flagellar assembly protein FliW [Malaciobacter molluscorum]AXX92626.1 putative flagellin level sensor protein FliW [Malaciobacter molluscorum LMG 25693]PHO19050.1 hypothetical protein CPU12_02040 [Malaciobacter molluscorum LMG 25693]RXJ97356.1 hypothetical protein CRV00_00525 [Malaciobacter molluscorum]